MSNENYIKKSAKKQFVIHGIPVLSKELYTLNLAKIKQKVESTVPKKFFKDLDYIYIGSFPELKARNVQSAYLEGAIYVTTEGQTDDGIFDSIVHEIAHSLETVYGQQIYQADDIAAEFVGKRKILLDKLRARDIVIKDPSIFVQTEFNKQFDEFLYKVLGYDLLNQICVGIFISGYAVTSLNEYFASGFEHYYLGDRDYLQKISPKLFSKILALTKK